MSYFDGFIAAVPAGSKEQYRAYALVMAEIFKEHGAVKIVETWGNDVPGGEITSFPMAVKATEEEKVVFSWIEWSSKDARDQAWAALMEDERLHPDVNPMPFDGKRLIYGGFEELINI